MAASDAQKRANAKYLREKVKTLTLRFYPQHTDLWEHLREQPNQQEYIRELIRRDIER